MEADADELQQTPTSRHYRGPQGLGETVARVLGERTEAGESVGGVEEEAFLKRWFAANHGFLSQKEWESLEPVAAHTAEHEVRFRERDTRAVKRTWPGTFGNVPRMVDGRWIPSPATPREYLHRLALQNQLFEDDLRLEGALESKGPSMIIGKAPDGLSLVTSQPWLQAENEDDPHPSEIEVSSLLQDQGFHPLFGSLYGWQHDEEDLIVLDAKPDNFIKTSAGILPVDLLLTEISPLN